MREASDSNTDDILPVCSKYQQEQSQDWVLYRKPSLEEFSEIDANIVAEILSFSKVWLLR
jgi:hypothetical protein